LSTSSPVKVFATRGSDILAEEVCTALEHRLPDMLQPGDHLTLSRPEITVFSNENILVKVENVRDHFVVVIHTQTPPVNEGLIELFALLDAICNAKPADILLVFPYMPYARSDQKNEPRISTMGCLLPCFFSNPPLEIKRVILLDPHDSHLKHYFRPAADEITATFLLIDYLNREVFTRKPRENTVLVFADAGAAKRFAYIPHTLGLNEAYIAKERRDNTEKPVVKRVVGEVGDKNCILFDDEILTGGTAIGDARLLLEKGANSVSMLAIHPIFADNNLTTAELIQRFENSPIERFIITDSVPVRHKLEGASKFTVLSIAGLLAEAIKRTVLGESLTELYNPEMVSLYLS